MISFFIKIIVQRFGYKQICFLDYGKLFKQAKIDFIYENKKG